MLKMISLSLSLLVVLWGCDSTVGAAESWNTERSFFPPSWAKQLPYRGELHLQFSPGFEKTNSAGFWSYVILYKLEGNVLTNREELERTLKAYDVGLYNNAVPASDVDVRLEPEKSEMTGGHVVQSWQGILKGFDSFFRKEPLTSTLNVSRWFCPESGRTFVSILRSPASATNAIWHELRMRGRKTLCHALEVRARHGALSERIAMVENGLGKADATKSITTRMRELNVPGLSLAVIANSKIDWAKAYGMADVENKISATTNTLFQTASISKSVAAVLAMRLAERGRFGLDEDVSAKLKSWRLPETPLTADAPVTIRRILSHTAGFNRGAASAYLPGEPLPSSLDALLARSPARDEPLRIEFKPGSRWSYSGGGFTVLQQLLEDCEKTNFAALARQEIFVPLGMRSSTFENLLPNDARFALAIGYKTNAPVTGKWRMHPDQAAAGLWSTASDLARLLCALGRSYAGSDETFLRRSSAQELWSSQFKNSALGFFLSGSGKYQQVNHDGANMGYRALMIFYPKLGHGAVVLTNADEGNDVAMEALAAVANEYAWPEFSL
ncbi:MAG: serine hydrolase domain-containing protein [Verrucomicrobiota bacterium]